MRRDAAVVGLGCRSSAEWCQTFTRRRRIRGIDGRADPRPRYVRVGGRAAGWATRRLAGADFGVGAGAAPAEAPAPAPAPADGTGRGSRGSSGESRLSVLALNQMSAAELRQLIAEWHEIREQFAVAETHRKKEIRDRIREEIGEQALLTSARLVHEERVSFAQERRAKLMANKARFLLCESFSANSIPLLASRRAGKIGEHKYRTESLAAVWNYLAVRLPRCSSRRRR